jgi:hypothetical protein
VEQLPTLPTAACARPRFRSFLALHRETLSRAREHCKGYVRGTIKQTCPNAFVEGAIPISSLYHFIVGSCLLIVFHGFFTFIILLLALLAYYIGTCHTLATSTGFTHKLAGTVFRSSVMNPVLTWSLALFIIVIKESYRAPNSSLGQVHKRTNELHS